MRDFFELLRKYDLYNEEDHYKSVNEYHLNSNVIEFVSLDEPQKIRGRKRHLLFVNEGNELKWEDFFQLNIRTTDKVIIDFNPSEEYHWLYDNIITRPDAEFFVTTYKDNPFLDSNLVAEIERLKEVDETYWRIYGLGQKAQSKLLVFNYEEIGNIPQEARFIAYGLDFGYTQDPTALVSVYLYDDKIYLDEHIYQNGMTNKDIVDVMRSLNIDRRVNIFADSSEPKSINEIHSFGFNVKPTAKGPDSINIGIDMMRRYKIHITTRSTNLIKEFRNYKYIQDKDGKATNRPVDAFNHGIDASRYAIFNSFNRPNYGKYSIR
jgi:phage terminase large subunit